jgi:hypothetical protein
MWAETTIDACYGEPPLAALARLKLPRADINGTPYVLVNGQPVPLTQGKITMGSWPANIGATFDQTLVNQSATIGIDPLDALKLFLSESGLQPGAQNGSAVGINQLVSMNYGYFAPLSASQYQALTAEQQLPYAFAYFAQVMKNHGLTSISGRDLYWLNFLPAYYVPGAGDSHVIITSASPYYAPNIGLDHGQKGSITAGDLQYALDKQKSTSLYQAIAPSIIADDPLALVNASVPLGTAIAMIGLGILIGASLADPGYVRSFVGA